MMPRSIKWVSVLVALMMVFGAVFGVGQAAADSLPGQLLYEVKLAAEQVRLRLTNDPEARAELNLTLAERRLSEIAELVDQGSTPDASAFDRAREQLESVMEPVKYGEEKAPEWAFQRLKAAIQRQKRDMEHFLNALPEAEQTPARELVRAMERVERHNGEGDAEGQQERNRMGTPPEVDDLPEPKRTPGPAGMPQPTDDSDRRADPEPTDGPGSAGQPGQGPGAGSGAGMEPTPQPREGGSGGGQAPAGPGTSVSPQPQDGGQQNNPSPGPGGDSGGKGKP
jgi:hypothetical protein